MSELACEESAGFLFKHGCKRAAYQRCGNCGKGVCGEHARQSTAAGLVCVSCVPAGRQRAGDVERDDDPYTYGATHYSGWGRYDRGHWGYGYYGAAHYARRDHDRDDFTEADGESLVAEGDEAFERDMGAS